jgi:hypothetical protein
MRARNIVMRGIVEAAVPWAVCSAYKINKVCLRLY